MFDRPNDGEKAEGVICGRESDVCVRESLVELCAVGESFVGEGRTLGGAFVVRVVEIMRVAVVVLLVGFVVSGHVRVRGGESGKCKLVADIESPLAGEREV